MPTITARGSDRAIRNRVKPQMRREVGWSPEYLDVLPDRGRMVSGRWISEPEEEFLTLFRRPQEYKVFDLLPEADRERECVMLYYWARRPYVAEIASATGLSRKKVAGRIERGERRIKDAVYGGVHMAFRIALTIWLKWRPSRTVAGRMWLERAAYPPDKPGLGDAKVWFTDRNFQIDMVIHSENAPDGPDLQLAGEIDEFDDAWAHVYLEGTYIGREHLGVRKAMNS